MPGGVLLQKLLPKGRCACPLLSSHFGFIFPFFLPPFRSQPRHFSLLTFYSFNSFLHSLIFLTYSKPLLHLSSPHTFFCCFTYPFSYPSNIFAPCPSFFLKTSIIHPQIMFSWGVSHRFWWRALEMQDHFK